MRESPIALTQCRFANQSLIGVALVLLFGFSGTPGSGAQERPREQTHVGVYGGTGDNTVGKSIEGAVDVLFPSIAWYAPIVSTRTSCTKYVSMESRCIYLWRSPTTDIRRSITNSRNSIRSIRKSGKTVGSSIVVPRSV